MKLVLPTKKYEESYYQLITSAKTRCDEQELGNALMRENETFEDMLNRLKNRRKGIQISKRDVPATVYWIIEQNKVIGTIDLRHRLNKDYFERLGHVAYYIKFEERNKGYATKALFLAKKKYEQMKINKILVTCYTDNIASSKVIRSNGGILENEFLDENTGKKISRYVIS